MAREAADVRETMWSATNRTLLIPLLASGAEKTVVGVAILADAPGQAPSRHLITATEAVVARLARYLSKSLRQADLQVRLSPPGLKARTFVRPPSARSNRSTTFASASRTAVAMPARTASAVLRP